MLTDISSKPEVAQFNYSFSSDQYVLWFDIPVDTLKKSGKWIQYRTTKTSEKDAYIITASSIQIDLNKMRSYI